MKKKKWLIPVVAIVFVFALFFALIILMINKGYGISKGRYLEAKNGQTMLILDNSPINMSNRTGKDLFDNIEIGDEILVIHDGIAESYPGKAGIYAVFKLRDGTTGDIPQNVVNQLIELGWLESKLQSNGTVTDIFPGGIIVDESFDIALSYANWTEENEIYFNALNKNRMVDSSVQHLPIYKFNTLEELELFKVSFEDVLTMNIGHDEVPSFNDTIADYDDHFFSENTLMLVYVSAGSGIYRFGVNNVYCDGTSFCVHVEQTNNPEIVTCDMAGWFITVAVPDSMIANCTYFDADLNNFEN